MGVLIIPAGKSGFQIPTLNYGCSFYIGHWYIRLSKLVFIFLRRVGSYTYRHGRYLQHIKENDRTVDEKKNLLQNTVAICNAHLPKYSSSRSRQKKKNILLKGPRLHAPTVRGQRWAGRGIEENPA